MQKSQVLFSRQKSSDDLIDGHSFFPISQSSKFCIVSVFFLFIVYNYTISPTIYWRDAPEFIDTAYSLGIAHPAGFPAYSTISKIFTFFPVSNIAMRVNYVSLFFAVLTIWIIFYVIRKLINICFHQSSNHHSSIAAMLSVFMLGSAASFWWEAVLSEVYTMNCFFLSLFFLVALEWYSTKKEKYLLLASFIFGISTGVYGANLLYMPALLTFYFLTKKGTSLNQLIIASAFFLLGYSIYLYLPIRSFTNPAFDWGNPETFKQFISHISDRKDSGQHLHGGTSLFLIYKNFLNFIKIMITETTIAGFFLTIIGAVCHFKKDKKTFFFMALIGFIHSAFFITTLASIAKNGSLFLSSFIIFSNWIGLGIYFLMVESSGYIISFKYKNIFVPVVISFIVFSFVKDFRFNNKSSYYLPRDHARNMYISTEPKAVLFLMNYWFAFRYFKDVENLRPDISIILISDLASPTFFNQVTPARFTSLNFPQIESKKGNMHEFMQLLISKNIHYRPIYSEIHKSLTKHNYQYLVPGNMFLMRFSGHRVDKLPENVLDDFLLKLKKYMEMELNNDQFFLDQEMGVRSYFVTFLDNFVSYLMKRGMYKHALYFLEFATSISYSNDDEFYSLKGVCYLRLGDLEKAEYIFKTLYRIDDKKHAHNFNLASLYFKMGRLEESKYYLKNSIKLNKDFFKNYYLLGTIYAKEGRYDESVEEIKRAIEMASFIPDKKIMQDALERIKKLKIDSNAGIGSVPGKKNSKL